jgi:hypothetical protein
LLISFQSFKLGYAGAQRVNVDAEANHFVHDAIRQSGHAAWCSP